MMAEFNSEYQLMDPIDFHSMFLIAVVNCLFPTIFFISSIWKLFSNQVFSYKDKIGFFQKVHLLLATFPNKNVANKILMLICKYG